MTREDNERFQRQYREMRDEVRLKVEAQWPPMKSPPNIAAIRAQYEHKAKELQADVAMARELITIKFLHRASTQTSRVDQPS